MTGGATSPLPKTAAESIQFHFKDEVLNSLAGIGNVAQFVSFEPSEDLPQRFSRVSGFSPNLRFSSAGDAVAALLSHSGEQSVNVRSFDPRQPKAHEFVYGLRAVDQILTTLQRLAASGLYTIANETIDVNDGGVSGVAYSGLWEFSPGDTPRSVEKPGILALDEELGRRIVRRVYGFKPALDYSPGLRVEFSLHPIRRGYSHDHTVIWEAEDIGPSPLSKQIQWPNNFSRFLGDKAFGLLIADALGLDVPATTVFPRGLAPFSFGRSTGSFETWIRTCPREPIPGSYTTHRGWVDPFDLLAREDPDGTAISSVLAQEGIDALYSGALIVGADGNHQIEGVKGTGEDFMTGRSAPEALPHEVREAASAVADRAWARLGDVRLEWVFDGNSVWVVQLHQGRSVTIGRTIHPGEPTTEHWFRVADGLEALRKVISEIEGSGEGVVLVGEVGVTSHFGDILRRAKIPSRIEPA